MSQYVNEQRGVALLHLLLMFIIVAGVVGTGYYVLQSRKSAERTLSQTDRSSSVPVTTHKQTDCTIGTDKKGLPQAVSSTRFTFCEPNGWTLQRNSGHLSGYWANVTNLSYDESKAAVVETSDYGSDGPFSLTIDTNDRTAVDTNKYTRDSTAARLTAGNLTIDSYLHMTTAKDPIGAGIDYLPQGTKQYLYVVYKGEQALVFHYNLQPNEADNSALVFDAAASTR